jgi:glycosyltransferase involved in cell wall biosynthesis
VHDPADADLGVLRLCSVFEPHEDRFEGDAARFDPIGGMQNHTAALSRSLDALGVRQTVLTSRLSGRAGSTDLGRRGRVHRVGLPVSRLRQLWAVCALPHVLRARSVDVVHAHQGEDIATLVLGMLAAAVHQAPLVVTLHCSVRHTARGPGLRCWVLRAVGGQVERWATRRAAAVVALVPRTAELLQRDGIDPERVHVLPSGFEPAVFEAVGPDAFPDLPRPRIGFVGRLAQQKRPALVVAAFERLRHPASLVLVGDGPMRAEVEAAVAGSSVRDRITRQGFVAHSRVPGVLASLDVLVLPSAYEEMGSVLVEAMASGLPVVATRVGGIPAVVQDGRTGLLVPPGDVSALAVALDRLVADPGLRSAMAASARERSAEYAWPTIAERVHDLYLTVRGTRPSTVRD